MARGPRHLPVSFSGASLTHFGGLVLLHQFVQRLGLRSHLAQAVRFPQRNNQYSRTGAVLALVYPILFDSTVLTVYGHQDQAVVGFNPKKRGRPSNLPLLCVEGQTRDCWAAEYHPGNTHVTTVTLPLWEAARAKVPPSARTVRVRADSAVYAGELVEALEARRAGSTILARMTRPLQQRVTAARYQPVGGGVSLAEFTYQPQGWPGRRRFVEEFFATQRRIEDLRFQ